VKDGEEVSKEKEKQEDEEYMDDSYDDVNLLSSLSNNSNPFVLPFSRLPPSSNPSHNRRHSRNRSLTFSNPLESSDPLIRRSVQSILDVQRPVEVGIRTVRCSVPDGSNSRSEGEEGGEGMIVCLEVSGPSGAESLFEISSIRVRVHGIGAKDGGSDVDVKEICGLKEQEGGGMRLKGGGVDQHNFLYSLDLSASTLLEQQLISPLGQSSAINGGGGGGGGGGKENSLPIAVATSPSQRFTARFGAEENEQIGGEGFEEYEMDRRREREREREVRRREEMFKRNLEVTVKGRVLVKSGKKEEVDRGYRVDAEEQEEEEDKEEEWISPTKTIESKWNYVIDISSFAYRPPPLQAYFRPPTASTSSNPQPFLRPTSIAAPPIPLLPPQTTTRPLSTQAERIEVESIAGSKRHTMASLANLSIKSPVLNRRSSFAPLPSPYRPPVQRNSSNRATPQAASTTNTPRRFFSLPPNAQSEEPSSISSNSNFLSHSTRTETPPPIARQSSPAVSRNSLPLPPPNGQNGESNRRTSWMSGLGIGRPSSTVPEEEGRTSWDRRGSTAGGENGLGLGLDSGSSPSNNPLPPLPPRPSEIDQEQYQYYQQTDTGRVLITVSLVPLRQVKSRRRLLESTLPNGGGDKSNLPPPVLPGALSPPASHHASFSFPPSSPNSPSPLASPNLGNETPQFSEAERTAAITSRMPRVGLLDVFLVQLFVVNQTDQIKRFVVGVPNVKPFGEGEIGVDDGGRSRGGGVGLRPGAKPEMSSRERVATLVPLENDVRIG